MRPAFDSAVSLWQGAVSSRATLSCRVISVLSTRKRRTRPDMVKAEWGTKRTCPKCATRFYDLGKDDPVPCINCGTAWEPEPVLQSTQHLPYEEAPHKLFDTAHGEHAPADADLGLGLGWD